MNIQNPIFLTKRAIEEVNTIILQKKISDDYGLRIGLKGAGCGATYLIGFDLKTKDDDIFQMESIKLIVDRKHLMYLFGVQIDFEEGENGKGFTFLAKNIIK